jgi:hypothetical protein
LRRTRRGETLWQKSLTVWQYHYLFAIFRTSNLLGKHLPTLEVENGANKMAKRFQGREPRAFSLAPNREKRSLDRRCLWRSALRQKQKLQPMLGQSDRVGVLNLLMILTC